MQSLTCFTVADAYLPMRAGMNTIRLASDKYIMLDPGDVVQMGYYTSRHAGKPAGEKLASEKFRVARVVVGTVKEILPDIWQDNHARPKSLQQMMKILERAYGGDRVNPHSLIVAIYA